MVVKSQEEGGGFREPTKPDSDWSLSFHHFSVLWFIIISWCTILLGFLAFWLIRRAYRRRRARKIMRAFAATTYPPSSGQEFNSSCPICLTDFTQDEELVSLPCGHIYKPACLRKQIESGYMHCGVCRGGLS